MTLPQRLDQFGQLVVAHVGDHALDGHLPRHERGDDFEVGGRLFHPHYADHLGAMRFPIGGQISKEAAPKAITRPTWTAMAGRRRHSRHRPAPARRFGMSGDRSSNNLKKFYERYGSQLYFESGFMGYGRGPSLFNHRQKFLKR